MWCPESRTNGKPKTIEPSTNQSWLKAQVLLPAHLPGGDNPPDVGPGIRALAEAVADGVLSPSLQSGTEIKESVTKKVLWFGGLSIQMLGYNYL